MSLKKIQKLNERSKLIGPSLSTSIGKVTNGFSDNNMANPPKSLYGKSTVIANTDDQLETFGADIPCDVILENNKQYGDYYNFSTPAGHIVEYNDTPGSERILIKHKNGTGINIGPDGSVIVSSNNRVDIISEKHTLSAHDGELTYEGNLTLNVTGDFNVNVGGEYNIKSTKSNITTNGPVTQQTNGEHNVIVNGNKAESITGTSTTTVLDKYNIFAKNDTQFATEGKATFATKGIAKFTSQTETIITAPDMNIAATNMSLFGQKGTIGGDEIIMYNYNMFTEHSINAAQSIVSPQIEATDTMKAPYIEATTVFKGGLIGNVSGDLDGTAVKAGIAGAISTVVVGSISVNDWEGNSIIHDQTETAQPDSDLVNDYINNGSKGVCKVNIDPNDILKNYIDYTFKTGSVSNRPLTTEETRRELRDQSNMKNPAFISTSLGDGVLSDEYNKKTADEVVYARSTKDVAITGSTPLGNVNAATVSKRIKVTDGGTIV